MNSKVLFLIGFVVPFFLFSPGNAQVRKIPLPPEQARKSETQIVLVRHAYPACSDVQCDLNPEGYNQAGELALFLNNVAKEGFPLTAVLASGTCRTVITVTPSADNAGLPVNGYIPREGLESCHYLGNGDGLARPDETKAPLRGLRNGFRGLHKREDIIAAIDEEGELPPGNPPHLYLVADHSNYVCAWFRQLGVPEGDYWEDCIDGNLALTDYADIYWLYDSEPGPGRSWRLVHYENAFDRGIPNEYEK